MKTKYILLGSSTQGLYGVFVFSGDIILFVSSKRRRIGQESLQLFLFLFPLQHMKRPALQNKQAGDLRMAFWARKACGTFEKRAPGIIFISGESTLRLYILFCILFQCSNRRNLLQRLPIKIICICHFFFVCFAFVLLF